MRLPNFFFHRKGIQLCSPLLVRIQWLIRLRWMELFELRYCRTKRSLSVRKRRNNDQSSQIEGYMTRFFKLSRSSRPHGLSFLLIEGESVEVSLSPIIKRTVGNGFFVKA